MSLSTSGGFLMAVTTAGGLSAVPGQILQKNPCMKEITMTTVEMEAGACCAAPGLSGRLPLSKADGRGAVHSSARILLASQQTMSEARTVFTVFI